MAHPMETAVPPFTAGGRWLSGSLAVVTVAASGLTAFGGFLTGPAAMVGSAKGTALVLLLVTSPTLVVAMVMAARGSLRAAVVWLGCLAAIVYNAQMLLYGTPFNSLFLLYTAMLGLSVWSIGALVRGDVIGAVGAAVDDRLPVRWIATYVWVVAGLNAVIWLRSIVPAVLSTDPTSVLVGTGLTTNPVYVQDLALWLPLAVVAAGWLWRRRPAGSVLVGGLLVMWIIESFSIATDQWMGSRADPGSVVASSAMALPFGLLAVVGLVPLVAHLRHVSPARQVSPADGDLTGPITSDEPTGRTP